MTATNELTIRRDGPRYWALVVAGQGGAGAIVQPLEALEKLLLLLLTEGIWPHSVDGGSRLETGDEVVFTLVSPDGPEVYGTASVDRPSSPIEPAQLEAARLLLGAGMPVDPRATTHAVSFREFDIWEAPWQPPSVNDPTLGELVEALDGVYTTGLVRRLDAPVFGRFVGRDLTEAKTSATTPAAAEPKPRTEPAGASPGPAAPPPAEPLSPAVPEMTGLLVQNWDAVDFGEPLSLLNGAVYGERTETPAGPVDALCEASHSGDMVAMIWADAEDAISLAESVPRRLTWLRRHKARPGQRVRGLLVTLQGGLDHLMDAGDDIEVRRLRIACTAPERRRPVATPPTETPRPSPPPVPVTEEDEIDFARRCMEAVRERR